MIALSIDADISAEENLLGKYVDDLQEDVEITDRAVIGTLKYVTGYTGFSGDVSEQSGNYLVTHAEVPDVDDVTITVEIDGAAHNPVTLDSDGILIARIRSADQLAGFIRFTASKSGCSPVTKCLALNGLTLESEA